MKRHISLFVACAAVFSVAACAAAQNAPAAPEQTAASTTRGTRQEATVQRVAANADTAIANRIDSLQKLLARIEAAKKIPAAAKAAIASTSANEIAVLNGLQAKIGADTSTTSVRADARSITADYRVYMLIEPQMTVLAASDRIGQIVSLMTIIANKLTDRVSALSASGTDMSAASALLADAATQMAHASAQASAAASTTAGLVPDGGNTAIAASNTAALAAGRTAIKTASADLATARTDFENVIKMIESVRSGAKATSTAQ